MELGRTDDRASERGVFVQMMMAMDGDVSGKVSGRIRIMTEVDCGVSYHKLHNEHNSSVGTLLPKGLIVGSGFEH